MRSVPLDNLSTHVAKTILMIYTTVLGSLTILTHVSQIASIPFRTYAQISIFIPFLVVTILISINIKQAIKGEEKDYWILMFLFLLGLLGGFLAIYLRRAGRINPDEYYYSVNPVYYLSYPGQTMGFEFRGFYTGQTPFFTVAFFTAGAFEYIQAFIAYWTSVQFPTVLYILMPALNGFVFPFVLFLVIDFFASDTIESILGACAIVFTILLMGDASWNPGAFSFARAFEGKTVLLFVGIPAFVYFTLQYFQNPVILSWVGIFMLTAFLTGLSTSAFMIVPILAFVLAASYWIAFGEKEDRKASIKKAIGYFAGLVYMLFFALLVTHFDDIKSSYEVNEFYPTEFTGYLKGFLDPAFPFTPSLFILFSLLTILLVKNKERRFLLSWMAFVLIFVLNPIAGGILIRIFRGVYFRLAYVFPFPLIIGISMVHIYRRLKRMGKKHTWIWIILLSIWGCVAIFSPSSMITSGRYEWQTWYNEKEVKVASSIVEYAPPGLMLAPYPISGAVQLLSAEYPQVLSRAGVMDLVFENLHRNKDSYLSTNIIQFLSGDVSDKKVLYRTINEVVGIHSIVLRNTSFLQIKNEIRNIYPYYKEVGAGWVLVWR